MLQLHGALIRACVMIAAWLLSSAASAQEPNVTLTIGPVHHDTVRQDHWVNTRLVNRSGRYLLSVRHDCQWLNASGRVIKETIIGHGDLLPGAAQNGRPSIHSAERVTKLRCRLSRSGTQTQRTTTPPRPAVRSVDNPAW